MTTIQWCDSSTLATRESTTGARARGRGADDGGADGEGEGEGRAAGVEAGREDGFDDDEDEATATGMRRRDVRAERAVVFELRSAVGAGVTKAMLRRWGSGKVCKVGGLCCRFSVRMVSWQGRLR